MSEDAALLAEADTSALPYVTAVPTVAIDGAVRARHEDFVVDEVPAYLPSGEGTHLFVRFEKTGTTTPDAVRRIATALGADPRAAGFAGLKDKNAVTTQWASFEGADAARLDAAIEGVRVIEAARHGNKLRTGHLRGNRFTLLLRGAEPAAEPAARACLDALAARGVPAYFGPQRFGHDGGTLAEGARWIFGGRHPRDRFRQKLLASAVQSAVFNHVLAARVRDGLLDAALDGDLLQKTDTGGLFLCDDPVTDTARAKRFELSGTGPMVGPKMREPEREARAREQAALTALGVDEARVRAFGKAGPGTRRPLRFRLEAVDVRTEPEGLRLAFTLPAGGYATVVLRELLRREVR